MNRWLNSSRKSRKRQISNDTAIELPDVIADLSLGSSITTPTLTRPWPPLDNMQAKEETFSYANRYLQAIEHRDSSGPSRAVMAPMGLGASVSMGDPVDENSFSPQTSYKAENISNVSPSRSNTYIQTLTVGMSFNEVPCQDRPMLHDTNRGGQYGFNHYNDFEIQRFRSMSSEPRSPHRNKSNDRRLRCSSATRVRHNQHKQLMNTDPSMTSILQPHQNITRSPAMSPHVSPPISPPMSPPSQRIHYQTTQSSYQGTSNSQPCFYASLPANSADPTYNPLCGTSHAQDSMPSSYGYKIPDLEALLSQASLTSPANLPMVLGCSTRIHNIQPNQEPYSSQSQSPAYLPLGIIVNAVCKTRDWLYVQTAHGAEGYVPYKVCLPLGILPNKAASCNNASQGETLAWECHGRQDVHHLSRETTAKAQSGYMSGIDITNRSRPRIRRRAYAQATESTNQTDSQKLLPAYSRTVDSRRRIRENTQNFTPRLV